MGLCLSSGLFALSKGQWEADEVAGEGSVRRVRGGCGEIERQRGGRECCSGLTVSHFCLVSFPV